MSENSGLALTRCSCGNVEIALVGPPIASVTCYCDDCQAGARQLAALAGSRHVAGADHGTPMTLYRTDRVQYRRGSGLLQPHKLRDASATNRMVASCCNAPVLVSFDSGPHWVSVFHSAFDAPPPIEARVNTRYAAPGSLPSDGVRTARSVPLFLIFRLLASRLAMALGR